jgi:Mrp family chromosome partitioning ATPase/capsular polysaccharide biosynthesis protein
VNVPSTLDRPATLAHYLGVLRRWIWFALVPVVLIPTVAFFLSARQTPLYRASAEVLLKRQDAVAAAAEVANPFTYADPERLAATQIQIARSPLVARKVVAAAHVPGVTPSDFLGSSGVSASATADTLEFSATSRNPETATRFANVYASQYSVARREIDTGALKGAIEQLQAQIDEARRARLEGVPGQTRLLSQLIVTQAKLKTAATLLTGNSMVLRPAEGAAKIAPTPRRTALLGGLFGIVLGLALAFLAEALDRRVRTDEEIGAALGLPLLGRLARPSRRLRKQAELVMLAEPMSAQAEAFRKLRTKLQLASRGHATRTIMFTSAKEREGKSTTAANVAIALARAGRHVALVDLDVRRPVLHSFFRLDGRHGITDVVLNNEDVVDAIQQVALPPAHLPVAGSNGRPAASSGSWNGGSARQGVLHVLACGTIPPADAEFLEGGRISAVLAKLREAFDIVIVDAPPLLAFGGAISLSTKVDAIVVVARSGIRRPTLRELARELHSSGAPRLGYVLTGVPLTEDHGYGDYGYGPYSHEVQAELGRGRQPA